MPTTVKLQFFVVIRTSSLDIDLQIVSVSSDLQVSLSTQFLEQANEFTAGALQVHPFHAAYKPNKDEVVTITQFRIPELLHRAAKDPQEFSDIHMPFTEEGPLVKAILGMDDGKLSGVKRFFFQHFDKTHILMPS